MDNKPKHRQIADKLCADIRDGIYARWQKIPSENELSDIFGASRQTVRQAVGSLERDGIVYRIRGSGTYVSALPERKRSTNTIGIVITYIDDYVFPSIIQGIEKVLTENGCTMSLGITYNKVENEKAALLQMLKTGVDGFIVEGTKSALPNPNIALYNQIKSAHIPCVFMNGYYENAGNGYVIIDDVKAGESICTELIAKGHCAIGGFFKSDDMQGRRRYQGFANAMNRYGYPINDDAVIWYTTEDLPFMFGGGMDDAILSRLKNVSGVVCYNDLAAVQLLGLFARNEKSLQKKYSVVSVDNSSLAKDPAYNLTTYEYPGYKIGENAAQALLTLLRGEKNQVRIKLSGKIIRRNSIFENKG